MSSERKAEHSAARSYGVTGGGFAEGQANPEKFKHDEQVGGFATGEGDLEDFPEDAQLGSFATGQAAEENVEEARLARWGARRTNRSATSESGVRVS